MPLANSVSTFIILIVGATVLVSYGLALYAGKWAYRTSGSSLVAMLFSISALIAFPFLIFLCCAYLLAAHMNAYPVLGALPSTPIWLFSTPLFSAPFEIIAGIALVFFLRRYVRKTGTPKSTARVGFSVLFGCIVLAGFLALVIQLLMIRVLFFPTYQGHGEAVVPKPSPGSVEYNY